MSGHRTEMWGAMKVRSQLWRDQPWLSDGIWLAHETLGVFAGIARVLPRRGVWSMTADGPVHHPDLPVPDLAGYLAAAVARSEPCVVHHGGYKRRAGRDEAMRAAGSQMVDVLDHTGRLWQVDHDYVEVATVVGGDWSWRLAPSEHAPGSAASLVLVDRKGRPRFAVGTMERRDGEG